MESKKEKQLKTFQNLHDALKLYHSKKTDLHFLTIAKAFENAIEYSWRSMKQQIEDEGLDAPSPKMAIKQAARLNLISDPEKWLDCLEARNNSVHDYFGISEDEYCALAKELLELIKKAKL